MGDVKIFNKLLSISTLNEKGLYHLVGLGYYHMLVILPVADCLFVINKCICVVVSSSKRLLNFLGNSNIMIYWLRMNIFEQY